MLLPNNMAARNTLETLVLSELVAHKDLEIRFLTPSSDHAARIGSAGQERFQWEDIGNPLGRELPLSYGTSGMVNRRLGERVLMKIFRKWAGWGNLVYRFNERHDFAGHRFKKSLPADRRRREAEAGNFADPSLGLPFPRSIALFDLIHRSYYSKWYSEPGVEGFLDQWLPDLMVVHHLQNQAIRPWISAARRRRIPMLGIVGSWDQPTTKGPLPPGLDRLVVQSQAMRNQLEKYHGVRPNKIEVLGWPQMDYYLQPDVIMQKDALAQELAIDPNSRIILYAANSERLGPHEPSIAAHLARGVQENYFGPDVSLVIRPHPNDYEWNWRFGGLHAPPRVVALPNESDRLDFLASLLKYSSVVMASTGTVLLDAVALDTCAVNIAFDGDLKVDFYKSIQRWSELDHYRPVIESGALAMAESFADLEDSISAYLDDPAKDSAGRAQCRNEQLEPFDGKSSKRLVEMIHKMAVDTNNA
jgi:hypothetical protein